jgi:hypothetical protein
LLQRSQYVRSRGCDRHRRCSQSVSPQTALVAPRELPLWGCKRTSFRFGGMSENCQQRKSYMVANFCWCRGGKLQQPSRA